MNLRRAMLDSIERADRIELSTLTWEEEKSFGDSPVNNVIEQTVGDVSGKKCACGTQIVDVCWNCDRPLCSKHAFLIRLVGLGLIIPIITSVCAECSTEIEDYYKSRRVD